MSKNMMKKMFEKDFTKIMMKKMFEKDFTTNLLIFAKTYDLFMKRNL